ncbi:MAG: TonB-dependent receptor [Gemmatimonadetes bacterium]|nr:TonB-dependent receptor [Gemmatimonadota bacterium]MBT4608836.1 TonB-dependent receptor [Gemmatimonadota bacterium]MBT5055912.1 TonB-dependent receptor [Gemmatimonadota bacterium]MBT5145067.1 TonB-dependent receptor [Gemmatimonadota bacterium]MBT5586881.1 TonB-dependent receptor [Gemmatimonadota bacterium]
MRTYPLTPYLLLTLVGLLLTLAGPLAAQPHTGRVVDGRSGNGIEGVLVRSGEHSTVTDGTGAFELPSSEGDSVWVSHVGFYEARLLWPTEAVIVLQARTLQTREVIVQAGLTRQRLSDITSSVHVVEAAQLQNHQHLQDLTDGLANVHWAAGTSRPRYFQIRGIGERSQYAGEGPPSFAVGFVVDDVELSGLGSTAMLFDMDQVEIHRGPQSTVFGPDAMAGLISMQSSAPGRLGPQIQASVGGDGLVELGVAADVPLTPRLSARLSYGGQQANGFRDNAYLGTDDSNGREEQTLRAKFHFDAGKGRELTTTVFHSRANNGYDAWAPDNNADFRTYSDRPGRDEQETSAISARWHWPLSSTMQFVSITAASTTDVEYSYDGDWGNDEFWAAAPYGFDSTIEGYTYDFFDRTLRQRQTLTHEMRLLSDRVPRLGGEGVVGVYAKQLREEDAATGYLFGGDAGVLDSEFDVGNLAVYSQWQRSVAPGLRLLVNLRADRHGTDYDGATDAAPERVRFSTNGWLGGGRVALNQATRMGHLFVALSRGYRPGGVNQHPRLSAHNRPYHAETLWNAESGLHVATERGAASLTLFHARRHDQQVELSSQQDPGDPNSFVLLTANAGAGWNAGAELEASYRMARGLTLRTTAGWLLTHTDSYSFENAQGERLTLGDREAAHAPSYTTRIGLDYEHRTGLLARVTLSATDGFFYSDSHNNEAATHQLLYASVGYQTSAWTVSLWGRNLLDERYTTRGFSFVLEPPAYNEKLYVTHGDPRQIGVTLRTRIGASGD